MADGACSGSCSASAPRPGGELGHGPWSPQPERSRHNRLPRILTAVALTTALALGGTALTVAASMRADLDRATTALLRADDRLDEMSQQLQAAQRQQQATGERLMSLESDVNGQPDVPATARRAARSVFTIDSDGDTGSGFAIEHNGRSTTLITNFHVVARRYLNGGRSVKVMRNDLTYAGAITDASESNDLAVITVSRRLPILPVAEKQPAPGEPVLVLGSPLGLGGTVTSGIVSAVRTEEGLDYLQFSAPISPGNSGGPVVNESGEVVGVAVMKLVGQGAEGLGFAIPTNRLCSALDVCRR